MIALIQRVKYSRVEIGSKICGEIEVGVMALIGIVKGDDEAKGDRLLERLLGYRVFPDREGKMNLSLRDIGGGLLLVPQFTLAADTRKGMRPSFTPAAAPEEGRRLFDYLAAKARSMHETVETGVFGADMQVSLLNDGPVTFWIES